MDLDVVAKLTAERFAPVLDQVARILTGTHACWQHLFTRTSPTPCARVPPPGPVQLRTTPAETCRPPTRYDAPACREASRLKQSHLDDLIDWGVVRPARRSERPYMSRVFLTPKADGSSSRALYDARPQNRHLDWCALPGHGRFRLAHPLHQAMVGTAHGREGLVVGAEVDFTSYFFQFRWGLRLQLAHGFRHGPTPYVFQVPVQGSALMPFVAQAVTLALLDGPLPSEDPAAFVANRCVVTYDNVLLTGPPAEVHARLETLTDRCASAGVVVGAVQRPSTTVTSCGYVFDLQARTWTLKSSFSEKLKEFLRRYTGSDESDAERLAGYAGWAYRALLLPLHPIASLLRHEPDPDAIAALLRLVEKPPSRALWPATTLRVPSDVPVVFVDGSGTGVGVVYDGVAHAFPWPLPRPAEEQQEIELAAFVRGLALATATLAVGTPLLVAGDNLGVLYTALTAVPRTAAAAETLEQVAALSRGPLWLSYVPTDSNPADEPSRTAISSSVRRPVPQDLVDRTRATAALADWTCARTP